MDAKEGGIIALKRNVDVHLQNGDPKSDIYTVPAGKKMIVDSVFIKEPTASLANATDIDFGDGAGANTWLNAVDLADLTLSSHSRKISSDNVTYTIFDAGDVFGLIPVTGATLDADAKADLFGYLFDA